MPRRRPARDPRAPRDQVRPLSGGVGGARRAATRGGDHWVRPLPGSQAKGPYRCPGCEQWIAVGVPHVVVWPADPLIGEGAEHRRHWHTPCWERRAPRAPTW